MLGSGYHLVPAECIHVELEPLSHVHYYSVWSASGVPNVLISTISKVHRGF